MTLSAYFIVLTAVCYLAMSSCSNVNTTRGVFSGIDDDNLNLTIFMGIPYASPPVGELRFSKPQPLDRLNDVYHANESRKCPQLSPMSGAVIGDEDCLHLNIYSPTQNAATKRDVMIWIHGGGFVFGSASEYDCRQLASQEDVVVVAINYRLNILGFFSTGNTTSPGNYGLWDQKSAIEWVKENIEAFGGDPSKITLFGESAGGKSVSFQMFSPRNNINLFQRVITQSGSALSVTYLNRDPMPVTKKVTDYLKCSITSTLLECMREKPLKDLMMAVGEISRPAPFYPIVDGDFLPHDLGEVLADYTSYGKEAVRARVGDFAKYDLMSGWNNQEGRLYASRLKSAHNELTGEDTLENGTSAEALKAALRNFPFYMYGGNRYVEELAVNMFSDYYMKTPQALNSDGRSTADRRVEVYTNIAGDIGLKLPTVQHLQLHADLSENSVQTYAYQFTLKNKKPAFIYSGPEWLKTGANHIDDVQYTFGWGLDAQRNIFLRWTQEEMNISRQMMNQLASFARDGNPGVDYEPFTYPRNQTYTVLKDGGFEKGMLPLNDVQRLWSAVDAAVIHTAITPFNDTLCEGVKGEYMSGMLSMTREEASKVMTGLLIGVVLGGLFTVSLLLYAVIMKCKSTKGSSKIV